jgi:hypothetical protein
MFIQFVIAMILGLAYPSTTNNTSSNATTTATTNGGTDAPDTGGDVVQSLPPK